MPAKDHLHTRIGLIREQHQAILRILAQEALLTGTGLQQEALEVIIFLVSVVDNRCPGLARLIFLDHQDILLIMVTQVEIGGIEITVVQNNQDLIIAVELTQLLASPIVIEAQDITVEPDLQAAQRRGASLFQRDLMNVGLCQDIALRATALDGNITEILLEHQQFLACLRLEDHLDRLRLTIRVGAEIEDARTFCSLRQVVLLVTCDTRDGETLDVIITHLTITVNHVVNRTDIVTLEDINIKDIRADKHLLGDPYDLIGSVTIEDDHVVDIGTVADVLVLLQAIANESLLTIDIELLVRLDHLGRLDRVEITDLRQAGIILTVFLLQACKPINGVIDNKLQMMVDALDLALGLGDELITLIAVELQDTSHLDLHQSQDIVTCHLADKRGLERLQATVDVRDRLVHILGVLELRVLVDPLLDEDLRKGAEEKFVQIFSNFDMEFRPEIVQEFFRVAAQNVRDRHPNRLVVADDHQIEREADGAVRVLVERLDRPVGIVAALRDDFNADLFRGQIVN